MSPAPDSSERLLVERCLARDEAAWSDLVLTHHAFLVRRARQLLGKDARNGDLPEEIIQEVWRSLLPQSFRVLRKFDIARGPARRFLMGLVQRQVQRYFDRRNSRRERELRALRWTCREFVMTDSHGGLELQEFRLRLSPRETQFFDVLLGNRQIGLGFSVAHGWKLVERIHKKWLDFRSVAEDSKNFSAKKQACTVRK